MAQTEQAIVICSLSNTFRQVSFAQFKSVLEAASEDIAAQNGECHAYITFHDADGATVGTFRDVADVTKDNWTQRQIVNVILSPEYMTDDQYNNGPALEKKIHMLFNKDRPKDIRAMAIPADFHGDFLKTHKFGMRRQTTLKRVIS